MVFFCCNACGESLKKNQVEKHYLTKCRQCDMLSCVDCGQEFWGNSYQEHVKCITEDQKYGGKDYKPKPGANKGEVKQELWIQQVQQAIENARGNPKLQGILGSLKAYSNIPRKKAKFENFVRNSLKIRDNQLVTQVWDIMEAAGQKTDPKEDPQEKVIKTDEKSETELGKENETDTTETSDKKNKRERKEERRQKANKREKKDKSTEEDTSNAKTKRKKNKHKHADESTEITETEGSSDGCQASKKKKKANPDAKDMSFCQLNETLDQEMLESSCGKFDWEQTICEVVKAAGGEISLKKLRKKVLAHYLATGKNGKSEEKIWAKFTKKVNNSVMVRVHKERVKFSK